MTVFNVFAGFSALFCAAYLIHCVRTGQGMAAVGAALLILLSAAAFALLV